ncbi:hypothetical protein ABFS83_12G049800 [Erythranthe nasuta]
METYDYSFKKAGTVPFKWEIRRGVPKSQEQQPLLDQHHIEFEFPKEHNQIRKQSPLAIGNNPFPPKLKPPPNGLYFQPPLESRFRSNFQLEVISSSWCFPSPLKKRKMSREW